MNARVDSSRFWQEQKAYLDRLAGCRLNYIKFRRGEEKREPTVRAWLSTVVLQSAKFSIEAVKEHYGRCYFWEFGRRQEWRQIEKYMVFGLWCLEAQKQAANKLIGLEAGPKALKPLEVQSTIFLSGPISHRVYGRGGEGDGES